MPYSDFKIEDLETKLKLKIKNANWLPVNYPSFQQDELLDLLLKRSQKLFLRTEKARSEFLIAPILESFHERNANKLSLFSGQEFNVDQARELNGFCDFIISATAHTVLLKPPVFCIVECKKTEPELDDFAQCGAELYAAKLFHEQKNINNKNNIIYGCVTSGFIWAFLKLENNILTIDPNYISLSFDDPYRVLSILQYLLNLSLDIKK